MRAEAVKPDLLVEIEVSRWALPGVRIAGEVPDYM
jgi:hypothetical protein